MKMKKLLSLLIGLLMLNPDNAHQHITNDLAGTTPDVPLFYFFDITIEKIQLMFITDKEHLIIKKVQFADERLAELKKLNENKITVFNDDLILESQKNKKEAELLANSFSDQETKRTFMERLNNQNDYHITVLTQLKEKVPERALKGIENAIENSNKEKIIIEKNIENIDTQMKDNLNKQNNKNW